MAKEIWQHYKRRTIESLLSNDKDDPEGKQLRRGLIFKPLLNIDLENVVPDELHLMLRITDKLTRNLINAAMSADAKHPEPDKLQRPMILSLLREIRNCGVSFSVRLDNSEEGGFDFSSLVGNDKIKLLQRLPGRFFKCQPKAYYKTVKDIWEVYNCTILYQFYHVN